jgi:glyoxylase-like metal-dependent hydrolase (beta-lactamase superfamily II)
MSPEERARVVAIGRDQAPEPGEYVELPSGLLWLRLPIPGALRHINVWLVPGDRGWFLVDTGMRTDAVVLAWEQLERRLPMRTQLESIVVTHHHPDHFGMARWLSDRFGVGVAMSDESAAAAWASLGDRPSGSRDLTDGFTRRLGVELDAATTAILRGGVYQAIVSGQPEVSALHTETRVPAVGAHWRVSVHHGHAPGHACLHDDAEHVMISGDQVLPTISSNISLYPSNESGDPLGDYLASLDQLEHLPEDTLVLPAHGRPFVGLHARLAALRDEHRKRLEAIARLCAAPQSTRAVTASLFNIDRLDPLNRLLATTEALAHLRRLELDGAVFRDGEGASLRWRAA